MTVPVKSGGAFDPEAYLDQAAAMAGLEIDPAYRPGVLMNLKVSYQIAQNFLSFPLPDDAEPAPVYKP